MVILKETTGQDVAIRPESVKYVRSRADCVRIVFTDNTNMDVEGVFKNIVNILSAEEKPQPAVSRKEKVA